MSKSLAVPVRKEMVSSIPASQLTIYQRLAHIEYCLWHLVKATENVAGLDAEEWDRAFEQIEFLVDTDPPTE